MSELKRCSFEACWAEPVKWLVFHKKPDAEPIGVCEKHRLHLAVTEMKAHYREVDEKEAIVIQTFAE